MSGSINWIEITSEDIPLTKEKLKNKKGAKLLGRKLKEEKILKPYPIVMSGLPPLPNI